jgi:hypothetical protein
MGVCIVCSLHCRRTRSAKASGPLAKELRLKFGKTEEDIKALKEKLIGTSEQLQIDREASRQHIKELGSSIQKKYQDREQGLSSSVNQLVSDWSFTKDIKALI